MRQIEGASHRPIFVIGPTALPRNWIEETERHLQAGVLGETTDALGSA
ncbi:hypothetical protein [Jiella pacifica]|uniref:Uncharacterized protein n=1 Tax=Jiella pacifica TaxID=2696469 RepID=A0A6N9T2V6_9HYPH|nr:hypothetical protein [Jiella pacifica]NDW05697.1 hypothetical protein [Jiella pacifica]